MPDTKIGSVERALSILSCFDQKHDALSLTAIAAQTGFYKSTVLRITESLVRYGYLVREENKVYRLGASIGRLGAVYQLAYSVEREIMPFLRDLTEKTEESSSYIILRNDRRVCQLQVNSKHPIRLHLEQGQELSLEGGASSRVLRAFRGDDWEDCAEVKARGWSMSAGERDPEVASVAVAVRGQSGRFYGALTVSGPVHRFDSHKLNLALPLVQDACRQLSDRLL